MVQENPVFAKARPMDSSPEGIRLNAARRKGNLFSLDGLRTPERISSDSLELLLADQTFGTEELSTYSPVIQQAEKTPCLFMHPKDAAKAGLNNKDRVTLHLEGGPLEIEVSVAENMAPGVMVLPRHRQIHWQRLKTFPVRIPFDRIKKI
jgi:predicted molibdopterin-dependent oxidoreductase YjgC